MSARKRQPRTPKPDVEWDFFSFPALAAFFTGMFVVSVILYIDFSGQFVDSLQLVLWFMSLIGFTFSVTHIATRQIARRRANRAREREDEAERERRVLAARARAVAESEAEGEPRRRRRRRKA
jgi:hypothetical protein